MTKNQSFAEGELSPAVVKSMWANMPDELNRIEGKIREVSGWRKVSTESRSPIPNCSHVDCLIYVNRNSSDFVPARYCTLAMKLCMNCFRNC